MQLLLDSDAFLWFSAGSDRLTLRAHALIDDENNDRFVSVVSLWEIAIKTSIGKLNPHVPLADLLTTQLRGAAADVLEIRIDHLLELETLPFHHRDPFDRLIIAQAIVAQMPIVSSDAALDDYGIQRLW